VIPSVRPDPIEEQPVENAAYDSRRALADDLRALAGFLENQPELPVSSHAVVEVAYFPRGDDQEQADEVDRVAGLLGARSRWEGEHLVCGRDFGRAAYRVVAIPEEVRARHRALMSYADAIRPD